MDQIARIEARLQSLAELSDLVGALRSMAASRAREAQQAFEGTRGFRAVIERAITDIAPLPGERPERSSRGPAGGADGAPVLLAIGSENGFVGGFNNRLAAHVREAVQPGESLLVVGRRAELALRECRLDPDQVMGMTSRPAGVTALARRISRHLVACRGVRILHAHYQPGATFAVALHTVVPLPAPARASEGAGSAPLRHLPRADLVRELAQEFVFAEVANALMESLASENGARLRAMDAASRNITDRLEKLQREAHMARQEMTTSDMLDVVIGAEAVNGERRHAGAGR